MDWILNHLQFVLALAGAVAYWLNERRKAATEQDPPPHETRTFEDPDLAARTRKIREEIQRKIEQRSGGHSESPPTVPAVDYAEPPPLAVQPVRASVQRQVEILEEQAAIMERLREAQAMKAAAQKRQAFEAATADPSAQVLVKSRIAVMDDLRSPAALRRAFILREVLGPPVGLR